jgi:hypothetical protein
MVTLLGLGLGFKVFIIPFIVCHMVTQQLLDLLQMQLLAHGMQLLSLLVLGLRCATIVTCAIRLVALTIALPILGFLTHLHLLKLMYIIHITFLLYSISAEKSTNKYYTHRSVICNFACKKSVVT